MLNSLHIENYRLFKTLDIPKLARVNLITGKNNVGKTALLEALRIWASEGESSVINNIIYERGDWGKGDYLNDYSTLFYDRNHENSIRINELELSIRVKLGFKYEEGKNTETQVGITLIKEDDSFFFPFGLGNHLLPRDKAIFLTAWKETVELDKLWEAIALTPKEDVIIDMLQLINPEIIRLSVTDQNAKVRLKDSDQPVPLKNFGDGINWILKIALALANAENTLLLIDEVDSGLHYSVQEQLWELIFKYAEQLNVQVFATTHSQDSIEAFTKVANKKEFEGQGQYIRLQRKRNREEIVAVLYNEDQLETAIEQDIETR